MKFGQFLKDNMVPEWRTKYVDYKGLKKAIKRLRQKQSEFYDKMAAAVNDEALRQPEMMDHLTSVTGKILKASLQRKGTIKDLPAGARRTALRQLLAMQQDKLSVDCEIEEEFRQLIENEFDKVSSFFTQQLRNYEERMERISTAMGRLASMSKVANRKKDQLRVACLEHYRGLQMLKNYGTVNYTAFHKALKKFDKNLQHHAKEHWLSRLDEADFHSLTVIDKMLDEILSAYAKQFDNGDRKKAAEHLRVSHILLDPVFRSAKSNVPLFWYGLMLGLMLVFGGMILEDVLFHYPWDNEPAHAVWSFNIYRGVGFVVGLGFLFAAATDMFANRGINYVFILELNARDHLTAAGYFQVCAYFGAIYMFSLMLFIKSIIYEHASGTPAAVPSWIQPGVLCGVMLFLFALPIPNFFFFSSRMWLWRVLGKTIIAPFSAVRFADVFIADQLTSLTFFLVDVQYAICVVRASDDPQPNGDICQGSQTHLILYVASALPSWWRFLQCMRRYRDDNFASLHPHVINGIKYMAAIVTTIVAGIDGIFFPAAGWSAIRITWLVCNVLGTFIRLYWDFRMDWGVIPMQNAKQRKYSMKFFVFSIVFNLLARFMWLFAFVIKITTAAVFNFIIVLGSVEVLRRGLWNLIRVENEHVNNADRFRAVTDVPIPFLRDVDGGTGVNNVPSLPVSESTDSNLTHLQDSMSDRRSSLGASSVASTAASTVSFPGLVTRRTSATSV